ncbi:MAG: hypothetical protein HY819_03440 [Acidobacteria bacterium]|nr:hypothetical protein [Acidobacteriota bacterium]
MRIGSSTPNIAIEQEQTQQTQKSANLNGLSAQKATNPTDSPIQNFTSPTTSSSKVNNVNIINSAAFQPASKTTGAVVDSAAATGPTNLQVTGTAAFRTRVAQDLAKFAPGTTVDSQGYVHAASSRAAGHDQGYALVNNLLNGGKKVTIGYVQNNAYTSSANGSQGTPGRPNVGSTAQVFYDPNLAISLPTRQANGTIKNEPIASSVVLAHELIHANHAQKGTIDRTNVNHTFKDGNTTYRENWRFEEFRTTGFTGARQGNEPTENSIRAELGFRARATYLDRSSWQRVSGLTSSIAANGANRNTSSSTNQLVGDMWNAGGAKMPNGQIRICNCFAC